MDNESKSGAPTLLPIHALPNDPCLKVRRLPGRPKKVERAPDLDERAYAVKANASRAEWIEKDELVRAMRGGRGAGEILQAIRERLACEIAVLEFDIATATAKGRDVATLVLRRLDGLTKLAAIEIARERMSIESFEPRSRRVRQVVELLVGSIRDVATEVLPPDDATRVLNGFEKWVDGWEARIAL